MSIENLFNAKFYMKQYGGFNYDEMDNFYPFEFEINYYLTIAHQKKKKPEGQ